MKILFLGGDERQKYACEFLKSNGIISTVLLDFELSHSIKAEIESADVIVLPIPISKDGIHLNMPTKLEIIELLDSINKDQILFAGKIPPILKSKLIEREMRLLDYYEIESFQIKNALLSAEGAIYYAKEKLESSINGANIAILGYGRIGKLLSYLLRSQGAKITVYARKELDLAWSKVNGINALKMNNLSIIGDRRLQSNNYDIIFNTVPYWVMDEEFAKRIPSNVLIIDLASQPHGIDEKLVVKYGLNYYRELGIPGRYAPKTAGEIIGQTIMENIYLRED